MGQKVSPIGLRLGIIRGWDSLWYADRDYADNLHQDLKIRNFVMSELSFAGVSRVKIERFAKKMQVVIFVAKPSVILSKKGGDMQKVQKFAENLTASEVSINLVEVKKVDTNATLVANSISKQIEKRISYKKAMKKALQGAMKMGSLGIKIVVSGRLDGAEIARTEGYRKGRIPLHTLRADIDFAQATACTTYGTVGVKVWVYHGDKGKMEY